MGLGGLTQPMVNKMEPNENIEPTCYNSTHQHGVDEKRRVQIPAKWRPAQAGTELTLVLWPQAKEGPCLRVLTPPQRAKLMRDLDAIPNTDPGKVPLKRYIGGRSVQATLDKAGRICLPEEMAKSAGIRDSAVFVGLMDQIEIWSPERYEKVQASDAVMAQEAFKMMG
jgi:MraZ protein